MRRRKSGSHSKLERQPEWFPWILSPQTWERQHAKPWLSFAHSPDQTAHIPLNSRESDPAASWCTKCHSSWSNLQPSLTLHSKHLQGWKKWQQTSSVGCTPMSQMRTTMLILSEWGYSHRRLGTRREFPPRMMLWTNISKGVSSKQASGRQLKCMHLGIVLCQIKSSIN